MSEDDPGAVIEELVFDCRLDAAPEQVWRAISIPAFRRRWLPESDLEDGKPERIVDGCEVRLRLQERQPPYLTSVVTFQVSPDVEGGTRLRIIHVLPRAQRDSSRTLSANNNTPLMRAA